MIKPRLFDFISLNDLPPVERIFGGDSFLKAYKLILLKDKNNAKQIMARYLGRKPMTIKKKLKSIIKEYNFRHSWRPGNQLCKDPSLFLGKETIVSVKNVVDLEEKLLSGFLEY